MFLHCSIFYNMPLYKIKSLSREETVQARSIILACAIFRAKYGKEKILSAKLQND